MVDAPSSGHSSGQTGEDQLLNIQNELIWGLTYRNYKENEKRHPLVPLHSPINIPFELCRAGALERDQLKKKKRSNDGNSNQRKRDGQKQGSAKRIQSKNRKPTLLDRNVWSQTKYMSFLSVPNMKLEEPTAKRYHRRCELAPCPPRFIQLAVPNKRRVCFG